MIEHQSISSLQFLIARRLECISGEDNEVHRHVSISLAQESAAGDLV